MRRSTFCLLALTLVIASCSKSSDHNIAMDAGTDAVAPDARSRPDVADAANDAGPLVDLPVDPCRLAEPCTEFQRRMSDCSCRANFDRRCFDASDCRPDEECRAFDDLSVCWFEAPPLRACPGGDRCANNDGPLLAAASRKSVTPLGFETPKEAGLEGVTMRRDPHRAWSTDAWNDCGLDGLCPGDPGYTEPDEGEGDGRPQGIWIAGFSGGRAAQYCPEGLIGCSEPECCVSKFAHDDIEVNLVVFRQGETTVVFAAIDVVGFFHSDIARIEEAVREVADIDLLVMAATHNHEGPDTSGQWGPGRPAPTTTGRTGSFLQRITDQTVAGIEEAVANLEPVDIAATVVDAGVDGLAIGDSRPPYIFDDNLPVVRVTSQASGDTVATMFSFGNHAEVRWSGNVLLTSDYYGFARKYVRDGIPATTHVDTGAALPALEGHGGVAVAFAGAVGGLINPGRGGAKDYAGNTFEDPNDHSWAATDAVGQQLAARVLAAELTAVTGPRLQFATQQFLVPVENTQLQLAAEALNLIERDAYNATRVGNEMQPDGHAYVLSQVSVVRLGEIEFFTAPGEMFPEMLVGGFPDRPRVQNPVVGDVREVYGPATCDEWGLPTPDDDGAFPCIVTKDQENPPDWSSAPDSPYGYERIEGQFPFFIGLGMDFLGYMVPPYDYEETGFFTQAPGSHYEETNGVGSTIMTDWETHIQACIDALNEL